MDVRSFDDACLFAREAGAYFCTDPFSTNVVSVYAGAVTTGTRPQGADDTWYTVADEGRVVGVAMHTPPHNLVLSRMPRDGALALAGALAKAGRQ